MPFAKVVKNKAYFKRYQTKFRRRREGKTDYRARKRLVVQPKNKYNSPRYRFVVRFTNAKVITQIIYAELTGDKVICQANSKELARYGLSVGLTNYAAAYCTGLLLARRLLNSLGLDEAYPGNEADGVVKTVKYANRTLYVEDLDWETERRPFRANMDVGTKACTSGSRLFGALKGAADGGLDVPHSYKRFPGYDREDKKYDPEEHRARIFGEHVAEYMRALEDDGEDEKMAKQFAAYIAQGIGADDIEGLYESVHEKIRADPSFIAAPEYRKPKEYHQKRRSLKQRKARIKQKKEWFQWKSELEAEE